MKLLHLCWFFGLALCSTTRHAKVRIENKSSSTLSAVQVRHAYGSIFKQRNTESMTWTNIAPGTATDASMIVEYLTGDPGTDWWQVGWTKLSEPMIDPSSDSGKIMYRQTNPDNFQNWVNQVSEDELTSGIIEAFNSIPYSVEFIKKALKKGLGAYGAALEAIFQISKVTVELLSPGFEKSDGLLGYKQCTLLKGDENRIVNIRIYDTSSKLQISPADSSNCDTVWKLTTFPWSSTDIS